MLRGRELQNKAVKLIETHFGSASAKMYENFYQDKDDKTILESVTELLSELVGTAKAEEQLNTILK